MVVNASTKLRSWIAGIENKEDLNFSPESLLLVESLILDRIGEKKDFIKPANKDFLVGALFYAGEVFKRNDSIRKLSWTNVADKMPILTCRYHSNSWVDIFQKFPSLIHRRSGQVLLTYFEKNLSYFIENSKRLEMESVDMPGSTERNYSHLLYDNDCSLNLKTIKDLLLRKNKESISVKSLYFHNEQHLVIDMNTGYYFHFELTNLDRLESSLQINCNEAIHFWGDEDPNGDYLNEYLFILQELKDLSFFAYNIDSGEISHLA